MSLIRPPHSWGGTPQKRRPLVMGIVNLTPDSFSDGGCHDDTERAVAHALRLVGEGADILDIGGESTRPGAMPVSEAVEITRTACVVAAIRAKSPIPISIDTMKPGVARAAVAEGASLWNDVTALGFAGNSLATAKDLGCGIVLMHMQGRPATMQNAPHYEDVVGEVCAFLLARARTAMAAGVARSAIWLDPGIGFGKTAEHSLTLLAALDQIVSLGFPVLLGASRKGFIRALDPRATDPMHRLGGSLAAALAGARAGVAMVRVHDVGATVQALAMDEALGDARHA